MGEGCKEFPGSGYTKTEPKETINCVFTQRGGVGRLASPGPEYRSSHLGMGTTEIAAWSTNEINCVLTQRGGVGRLPLMNQAIFSVNERLHPCSGSSA